MKFKIKYFIAICIILCAVQTAFSVELTKPKKLKITVTTSNIAAIINEICRDKVEVTTLIQPTICPSTYDVDAQTVKDLSKTSVMMYHSWQSAWVKELKYKVTKIGIIYKQLKTEGNFMIPYINLRAAEEIKDMLVVWDDTNRDFYEENFVNYVYKVNFLAQEISKDSISRHNIKIACNNRIAPFLEWAGFNIVAKYGKSEDMSVAEMANLIKRIKKDKVSLVVDNLQAGTDTGRAITKDSKIKYTVISNFTLGNSYIATLKDNIEKLKKALK